MCVCIQSFEALYTQLRRKQSVRLIACDANESPSLLGFWHFDSRRKKEEKTHFQSSPWKGSLWNRCFLQMQIHYFIFKEKHLNKAEALRFPQRSHRMVSTCKNNIRRSGTLAARTTLNAQLKALKIFGWAQQWSRIHSAGGLFSFPVFPFQARKPRSRVEVFFFPPCVISLLCLFSPSWFFQGLCSVRFVHLLLCVHDTFIQGRLFVLFLCSSRSLTCNTRGASSKLASSLVRIIWYSPHQEDPELWKHLCLKLVEFVSCLTVKFSCCHKLIQFTKM